MLTHIQINHLITIEKLSLELKKGTTVITGESGVGKSILMHAIELALGARATSDLIRKDQEKAEICLSFDLTYVPAAREWLKSYDLEGDSKECLIRRSFYQDGRSRSYINHMPITLQPLREFSALLLNIQGQHEHQALLKSDVQRALLDRFAGHDDIVFKVQHLAQEWHAHHQNMIELKTNAKDRANRADYLTFQLRELQEAKLIENEFTSLDLEHKQLANADELLQHMNHALSCLADNESSHAIQLLNETIRSLEMVQRVDPKISTWIDAAKNIHIQLSDLEDELRRYLEHVTIDPETLRQTEERLSLLFNLSRKHKVDPHELFQYQQKLEHEMNSFERLDDQVAEIESKMKAIETNYKIECARLTESRMKAAKKLEKQITQTMQSLSLPHGQFKVVFEPHPPLPLSSQGSEKIHFEIQTNPDQPLLPLSKIASGGELSRISLAIHMATAKQQTIPILIFDEIDVGVGGQIAERIGKLLSELGKTHQVFCITHAPQVAAHGMQHLCVEKTLKQKITYTTVNELTGEQKIKELARMLGGAEITQKTLAHAAEMLEKSAANAE